MNRTPKDPPDQVPRKLAFEQAHPEVRIEFRGPHWRATWPGGMIVRLDLRILLDVLGQQDPPETSGDRTPP
jgi:hypothetical protein